MIAVAAAAAAAFVGAVGLGGAALAYSQAQNGNPAAPPIYTSDYQAAASTGQGLATGAYVCLGAGVILAVVDGILLYERHRARRP
jgi:hypothetical protein